MPSSHLILGCPLLLLPQIPPSIKVFSNDSTLRMRWPKYWSFNFSTIPSKEIPGLLSFRMDWLDLLAVQDTQESSPTTQFKSLNFCCLYFYKYVVEIFYKYFYKYFVKIFWHILFIFIFLNNHIVLTRTSKQ